MSSTTYIYALIDPRNQSHHYIGKTIQNPPQKRLRQHLLKPATQILAQWLNELEQLGLKPEMLVLEAVPPDADWRAAEIYWIRYGLSHDWCLKNTASGGDNYPLELLVNGEPDYIIPRVIYGSEATFRLLTTINAYVMKGKNATDNTFRDLLHQALLLAATENIDDLSAMKQDFCNHILSHGIIQMGRGWRVPILKNKNPFGGEFFTVGKPFTINGIAIPGKWDKAGWRTTIKMYQQSSEILDTLATELRDNKRRGYDSVLKQTLSLLAESFDQIVAM